MKQKNPLSSLQIFPGFFRPVEAARYLSVSPRTLRDWTNRRMVPVIRLGKKMVLYRRTSLDEALAKLEER